MASTRSPVIATGVTTADTQTRALMPSEKLLTAQEVAAWLGVSARWVLAHAAGLNRPILPSVKLGKASDSSAAPSRSLSAHVRALIGSVQLRRAHGLS